VDRLHRKTRKISWPLDTLLVGFGINVIGMIHALLTLLSPERADTYATTQAAWYASRGRSQAIPHRWQRWKALYRRRSAVEREVGRLKHEYALLPLRVRGLAERVCVHALLCVAHIVKPGHGGRVEARETA
jgi:hypothetical protein